MPKAIIDIVGMCSFLNITNDPGHDIQRGLIIVKAHHHVPFIAWNKNDVTMGGKPEEPVTGGAKYRKITLKHEELKVKNNLSTVLKFSGPPFSKAVPSFTAYSKISPLWERNQVPKRTHKPVHGAVDAFLEIEKGELTPQRLTQQTWVYCNGLGQPSISEKFSRRVRYEVDIAADVLEIDASGTTLTFKGSPPRIWLGSLPDPFMVLEFEEYEPPAPKASKHAQHFYNQVTNPPADKYLPHPFSCPPPPPPPPFFAQAWDFLAGLFKKKAKDPNLGYCGPDNKP